MNIIKRHSKLFAITALIMMILVIISPFSTMFISNANTWQSEYTRSNESTWKQFIGQNDVVDFAVNYSLNDEHGYEHNHSGDGDVNDTTDTACAPFVGLCYRKTMYPKELGGTNFPNLLYNSELFIDITEYVSDWDKFCENIAPGDVLIDSIKCSNGHNPGDITEKFKASGLDWTGVHWLHAKICIGKLNDVPWIAEATCVSEGDYKDTNGKEVYCHEYNKSNFEYDTTGTGRGSQNDVSCSGDKHLFVLRSKDLPGLTKVDNSVHDRGIIQSYKQKVLEYPLNDGFLLDPGHKYAKMQQEKNIEVYKDYLDRLKGGSGTGTQYCLYELFGEDLHWYRYFGEETYSPGTLDHIWSMWDADRIDELKLWKDIIVYDGKFYLSAHVYANRADPLTADDIDNGYVDPRITYLSDAMSGYDYVKNSFILSIAKYVNSFVGFALGPELINGLMDFIEEVEASEVWEVLVPLINTVIAIAMAAFIISLVKKAVMYARGTGAGKDFGHRLFIGAICILMLVTFIASPSSLNKAIKKIYTTVDTIFNETLNASYKNDPNKRDIIYLSEGSEMMSTSATLWYAGIFAPWCKGQFGDSYKNLYTQYADLSSGQKAMDQSHDEVDPNDTSGLPKYNSAKYTGDVSVPLGGGYELKNWAAYLMSCGSEYHLDANMQYLADKIDPEVTPVFPLANTTARNTNIMADTFRVLDAQMNIAPKEYADGTVVGNYTDSRMIVTDYRGSGRKILINCLLLGFFIPIIFLKLKNGLLMIITPMQFIYHSILELFKEDNGVKNYFSTFGKAFLNYFLACLKSSIMIFLYGSLIGADNSGLIHMILFIIISIIVLSFSMDDMRRIGNQAKHMIQNLRTGRKIRN